MRWEQPEAAVAEAWRVWTAAAEQPQHPCHLVALATAAAGTPAVRTVVLRRCLASERELLWYSDRRSDKLQQLRTQPVAELMAYDPEQRLQLRAAGCVEVLESGSGWESAWAALSARQRAEYARAALPSGEQSTLDEARAKDHFVLFKMCVSDLDVLHLGRIHPSRVKAAWRARRWDASWVLP